MKENKVPCENCEFCGLCNCGEAIPTIQIISSPIPVKRKRRMRNAILLSITGVMIALAMISVASADSTSLIPIVTLLISGTWLVLFAKANGMDKFLYIEEADEDE